MLYLVGECKIHFLVATRIPSFEKSSTVSLRWTWNIANQYIVLFCLLWIKCDFCYLATQLWLYILIMNIFWRILFILALWLQYCLQINTWAFPYWPGYHPETPILAREAVTLSCSNHISTWNTCIYVVYVVCISIVLYIMFLFHGVYTCASLSHVF
jgi:hypothetical protein